MCGAGERCESSARVVGHDQHQGTPPFLTRTWFEPKAPTESLGPPLPLGHLVPLTPLHRKRPQPPRKSPKRDRVLACDLNQSRCERITAEGIPIDRGSTERVAKTSAGERRRVISPEFLDHDNLRQLRRICRLSNKCRRFLRFNDEAERSKIGDIARLTHGVQRHGRAAALSSDALELVNDGRGHTAPANGRDRRPGQETRAACPQFCIAPRRPPADRSRQPGPANPMRAPIADAAPHPLAGIPSADRRWRGDRLWPRDAHPPVSTRELLPFTFHFPLFTFHFLLS